MTQVHSADCRKAPARWWRRSGRSALLLALMPLLACSPALDWRQVRPEGWHLQMALPCRPATQTRVLALAGRPVELTLLACSLEEHTYALASADLIDPGQVGPALRALGQAALANLQGRIEWEAPAQVKGMTPYAEARHWRLRGQRPDGQAVLAQVLVFAHGARVFQATVIGPQADDRLAQALFEPLEVLP